ncbi:hypothetical protein EXIGLDRAFT_730748, partial [Exidia glandulosa HHB12029]
MHAVFLAFLPLLDLDLSRLFCDYVAALRLCISNRSNDSRIPLSSLFNEKRLATLLDLTFCFPTPASPASVL